MAGEYKDTINFYANITYHSNIRRVWRCQRGNQNTKLKDRQLQCKEKVQKDKQQLQNIHIKLKIE